MSYLSEKELLSPPLFRPAYSDRMAYVMAELSALAYRPEGPVKGELQGSGFELLKWFDVGATQGFVCRKPGQFVAVVFRGTEKKFEDWLTDADARPRLHSQGGYVHSGFLRQFYDNGGELKSLIEGVLEGLIPSKLPYSAGLPVYVTGHSLGGALALICARLLRGRVTGACYTFGAPRVADYDFFRGMKTPVYRVVNSSDIVPRVPPVATGALLLLEGIGSVLSIMSPTAGGWCLKLSRELDTLWGYRHYGDLRYLTDIQDGRFADVELLSNPRLGDRVRWTIRALRRSWTSSLKNHGMDIYRQKLLIIATRRNEED